MTTKTDIKKHVYRIRSVSGAEYYSTSCKFGNNEFIIEIISMEEYLRRNKNNVNFIDKHREAID